MIVSPNMALAIWNLSTDPYDSSELADNLARLDEHDHGPGKGVLIGTNGLADGSVTAAKLAVDAIPVPPTESNIDTARIVDLAVTTPKIANGAVTTAKLGTFPAAKAVRSTSTAIASIQTTITFTSATFDLSSMWTAPDRLILPVAGTYVLSAGTVWDTGANSQYAATRLIVNGSTALDTQSTYAIAFFGGGPSNAALTASHSVISIYRATAAEYVQVQCIRDLTTAAAVTSASLSAAWIGA